MNSKLTTWLNVQKPWLKHAVCLLVEKGSLEKADLVLLKDILIGTAKAPDFAGFVTDEVPSETKLQILKISSVSGVDRLNPRVPLLMANPNMTVIYGANGSGKSGYVRLLKEITGKPSSRPLKHNVFSSEIAESTCEIAYTMNGSTITLPWKQADGVAPDLRGVDIFDSLIGAVYIDSEMEVAYAPAEVSLLTRLVEVCKQVEAILADEQSKLVSAMPVMPPEYSGTTVALKYKDIQANNCELTTWTPELEARFGELEALLSTNPAAKKKALEGQKVQADGLLAHFRTSVSAISPEYVGEIAHQIEIVADNQRASNDATAAFSDVALLDGVASDSWKRMWEAARLYSKAEAYKSASFPNVEQGARCVLCNQILDEAAQNRLVTFESFVKSSLSATLNESQKTLAALIDAVKPFPEDKVLETMCVAAGVPQTLLEKLKATKSAIDPVVAAVKNIQSSGASTTTIPTVHQNSIVVMKELEAFIVAISTEINNLAVQTDPVARAKLESEYRELKALKWTVQQANAIQVELSRLSAVARYQAWIDETGTRPISLKAGELATELITQAFVDRFNRELISLGATTVQVEIKNSRTTGGRPQYRMTLRGLGSNVKVSEILSEGEHRIVALAAFLADVTGRQSSTPFIFDDPISSLDQRYEERTAKRLAQLCDSQQVIVFTHRLSFLNLLLENREDAAVVGISAEDWGTGQPGETPIFAKNPAGALSDLKVARLAKARKALRDEGTEAYYIHGKAVCSDFRILMERIIEQILLDDVIVRHRRDVKTMKIHSLCKISPDDCAIVDEMMSKYSGFEHSQSGESPVDIPTPDDIEKDIARVMEWIEARKKKPSAVGAAR